MLPGLRSLLAGSAILLAACTWAQEATMLLRTERPGNLFAHGKKVVVHVEARGAKSLDWRVTDCDGQEVGAGRAGSAAGKAMIEIRDLPRGYYEVSAKAGTRKAKLALGVVTDHSATDPPSGRLNVDGATAWLERKGRHETLARMLRMVGIGWVRERFSWGATEPQKGKVRWQQYDAVADAFTKHGVRVYQIFHDSPGWSHGGKKGTRNPQDLRDVYRFAKRLAEHYQGRVRAWEVWNEPDIFFWPDLGDTFAGVQKAAYLGFKAGDPKLPVLLGSFCRGYCAFDEGLFEAGISEYFDIFNWHTYLPPAHYPATLSRYLELLKRYGCGDRPVWLTEAGIRLQAREPGGELNAADERRQADFVPKSFAWSLAAGTDRHFFFVYPYYLERGVQFGSLRKDLSPRPGFIAIAAAVDTLGEARYLGCYASPRKDGFTALAFHNGSRRVLVLWSSKPREVELSVAVKRVALANVVGRRESRTTKGGRLKLSVGPSPRYVIGLGKEAMGRLAGRPRLPGKLPANNPSPVVIRGEARVAAIDKNANCYMIGDGAFTYTVEACNLTERESANGRIQLEAPKGWKVEPQEIKAPLGPMGRLVQDFTITPGKPSLGAQKIWVRPKFEKATPAPSVSYFRFDLSRVKPAKTLGLGLNDPARWRKNISGNGTMDIRPVPGGGVRFEIEFTTAGDRWCYPRVDFSRPRNFSRYDGISFEYRCHADDEKTVVRLQVVEPRGTCYLTSAGWKAKKDWTGVACMFEDLSWGSYSPKDPNGTLDTKAIQALMIGLNTPRDKVWLEVRNVRLARIGRK